MERSSIHCSKHSEEDWKYCVLCRTRVQSAKALQRAQTRSVKWPTRPGAQSPPGGMRDLTSCTIDEAISTMAQYLNISTRHCKKYYNGQSNLRKNDFDKHHCSRFHSERPVTKLTGNPLSERVQEGMCVSVAPGTYSITAGEWGGVQTQTHVVKLTAGQTANLDFVF